MARPKKAVAKAVPKPGRFTKGDPRINRTKPGTGRPPDAFKQMCRGLASSADVEKAVRGILTDPKHPAFVGALKWATENGYGKAPQPLVGDPERPIAVQVWQFGNKLVAF